MWERSDALRRLWDVDINRQGPEREDSRNEGWLLANSRQGNRSLIPTAIRNQILPTKVSLEAKSLQSLPVGAQPANTLTSALRTWPEKQTQPAHVSELRKGAIIYLHCLKLLNLLWGQEKRKTILQRSNIFVLISNSGNDVHRLWENKYRKFRRPIGQRLANNGVWAKFTPLHVLYGSGS